MSSEVAPPVEPDEPYWPGPWRENGPPWARGRRDPRRRRHIGLRMAVLVGVVQVLGTYFAAPHQMGVARHLDALGYALLVASPLALTIRHRYRMAALVITMLATVAYFVLGYPYGPGFLALLVAAGGAIIGGRRAAGWLTVGVGYVLFAGFGWLVRDVAGVRTSRPDLGGAIAIAAWIVIMLGIAEAARNRSRAIAQLARTQAEEQRARAEERRRRASDERLRMARELHDVLGHHLSLINVQAGVGLHLMDDRPEQARTALLAIKEASAEALREVRSVLGVLRAEDEQAPRAPAPKLANLPALVDGTGAAVQVEGPVRELPAEVERAAYRIAQEALTNVRRHAGDGARAEVTIGYEPDALTVRVVDDGVGSPGEVTEGGGVTGMRERAEALGGTLRAGSHPGGGFEVYARLPVAGPSETAP